MTDLPTLRSKVFAVFAKVRAQVKYNNLSERDLRKCKNRQKISGGFGLSDGRDMACKILSFFETCKRRSLDLFRAVNSVWACAGNLLGE